MITKIFPLVAIVFGISIFSRIDFASTAADVISECKLSLSGSKTKVNKFGATEYQKKLAQWKNEKWPQIKNVLKALQPDEIISVTVTPNDSDTAKSLGLLEPLDFEISNVGEPAKEFLSLRTNTGTEYIPLLTVDSVQKVKAGDFVVVRFNGKSGPNLVSTQISKIGKVQDFKDQDGNLGIFLKNIGFISIDSLRSVDFISTNNFMTFYDKNYRPFAGSSTITKVIENDDGSAFIELDNGIVLRSSDIEAATNP
jgi:hypothetical protein